MQTFPMVRTGSRHPFRLLVLTGLLLACIGPLRALEPDCSRHHADHPVRISALHGDVLAAEWGGGDGQRLRVEFSLTGKQSLLRSIAAAPTLQAPFVTLAKDVDVQYRLTIGSRKTGLTWYYTFFDNVDTTTPRPETYPAQLMPTAVRVEDDGSHRVRITFNGLKAGCFSGDLVVHIYDGSPLLHFQASMGTMQPWCAYLYEVLVRGPFTGITYRDTEGKPVTVSAADQPAEAKPLKVRYRTVIGSLDGGAVAVFPPPHAGFYPTDRSDNFGFVQAGRGLIGTHMDDHQDTWRPWIDAPRGRTQVMDTFLLLSPGAPERALESVLRYTNGDVFKALPGCLTMVEHFHAALTAARMKDGNTGQAETFRTAMMDHGVNLVQLMEFHGDGHPDDTGDLRLQELKGMFDMCRDLTVPDRFLFLPGEEYNNFSKPGFHWAYLFPRPVYFQRAAAKDTPFNSKQDPYGTVYQVRNAEEMLAVLRAEKGLAWVSHPRIKNSCMSPDNMLASAWYQDDCWQAGDWKAMPADLSYDHLGFRSLTLMDDTAQWGFRKSMLGEVDTFLLNPTHEIYLHLNANYLRLPKFPRADDWSGVLDCVRRGDFFTTTGEVLIHDWQAGTKGVTAELEWYFPPAFARIVWGDAAGIHRKNLPLVDEREAGRRRFTWDQDLSTANWVRFEAWDVARNGAFTQPFWFREPAKPAQLTGAVTRFTLVDAELGLPVPGAENLTDGAVLDLARLPKQFVIQAHTNPLVVGSVALTVDDGKPTVMNAWPYASGAEQLKDPSRSPVFRYAPMPLPPGRHTLTATPWTGRNGTGTAGQTRTLTLTLR